MHPPAPSGNAALAFGHGYPHPYQPLLVTLTLIQHDRVPPSSAVWRRLLGAAALISDVCPIDHCFERLRPRHRTVQPCSSVGSSDSGPACWCASESRIVSQVSGGCRSVCSSDTLIVGSILQKLCSVFVLLCIFLLSSHPHSAALRRSPPHSVALQWYSHYLASPRI